MVLDHAGEKRRCLNGHRDLRGRGLGGVRRRECNAGPAGFRLLAPDSRPRITRCVRWRLRIDAILAGALCPVERVVGRVDERVGGRSGADAGDAEARGQVECGTPSSEKSDRSARALRTRSATSAGTLDVGSRAGSRRTPRRPSGPRRRSRARSRAARRANSRRTASPVGMAVRVVDGLEVVEVGEDQRDGAAEPLDARELGGERLVALPAVGEPGELVDERLPLDDAVQARVVERDHGLRRRASAAVMVASDVELASRAARACRSSGGRSSAGARACSAPPPVADRTTEPSARTKTARRRRPSPRRRSRRSRAEAARGRASRRARRRSGRSRRGSAAARPRARRGAASSCAAIWLKARPAAAANSSRPRTWTRSCEASGGDRVRRGGELAEGADDRSTRDVGHEPDQEQRGEQARDQPRSLGLLLRGDRGARGDRREEDRRSRHELHADDPVVRSSERNRLDVARPDWQAARDVAVRRCVDATADDGDELVGLVQSGSCGQAPGEGAVDRTEAMIVADRFASPTSATDVSAASGGTTPSRRPDASIRSAGSRSR